MHDEVRENRRAKDGESKVVRKERGARTQNSLASLSVKYELRSCRTAQLYLHASTYEVSEGEKRKRKKARTRGEIERKRERAYVYVRKMK